MRVSNAIIAALLGLTMSACTSKSKGPVVVPDNSVKPATRVGAQQAAGQQSTRPGEANAVPAGGLGDVTAAPATVVQPQGTVLPPDTQTRPDGTVTPPAANPPGSVVPTTTPPASSPPATTPPAGNPTVTNPPAATPPATTPGGGKTRLNDLTVGTPLGFAITQQAQAEGVTLVGFAKGDDFGAVYSKQAAGMTTQSIFVNGSQVTVPEATKKVGNYDWKVIETSKTVAAGLPHAGTYFVMGFLMEKGGVTYYGYGKSTSADGARSAAQAVLSAIE